MYTSEAVFPSLACCTATRLSAGSRAGSPTSQAVTLLSLNSQVAQAMHVPISPGVLYISISSESFNMVLVNAFCLPACLEHLQVILRALHHCANPAIDQAWLAGWDTRKFARRAGFALFGIFNGTELNPEFHESIQNAVGSDGAILVCNLGGSLEPVSSSDSGMQSRCSCSCPAIDCHV